MIHEHIAKLIVKKKALVQKYLNSKGVKTTPRDTYKDVSEKLYGLILSSQKEAEDFDAFLSENKSGFAQFIPMLASLFTSDDKKVDPSQGNMALMNQLIDKEKQEREAKQSQTNLLIASGITILLIGVIVAVFILMKKK